MVRSLLLSVIVLVTSVQFASADFVTGITLSPTSAAAWTSGAPVSGTDFTAFGSVNTSLPVSASFQTIQASNQITLNLTVLQLNVPFTVNFSTAPQAAAIGAYAVTVNVFNQLANNREMGGFDVVGSGLPSVAFNPNAAPVPPAASPNAYAYTKLSNTHIHFGGLNGGGGATPWNTTQTFQFIIRVSQTDDPGSFNLQFTANPEPGSLALAGILGAPMLCWMRRRRQNATTVKNQSI